MHLTMMHMGIIIATLVCVIGIGIYSSRSVRSAAGYSVGGRSAGAPLVAGSIAGTVVGGGATVGTAQLAYHFGLSAWWFTLGSGIAFIIMGLFYAKKMRGTGLETIGSDEVHRILLGSGCVILENLRLEGVETKKYFLACAPLKLAADASPVRACLIEGIKEI